MAPASVRWLAIAPVAIAVLVLIARMGAAPQARPERCLQTLEGPGCRPPRAIRHTVVQRPTLEPTWLPLTMQPMPTLRAEITARASLTPSVARTATGSATPPLATRTGGVAATRTPEGVPPPATPRATPMPATPPSAGTPATVPTTGAAALSSGWFLAGVGALLLSFAGGFFLGAALRGEGE